MKRYLVLITLLLLVKISLAEKVTFKIVHASTLQPIEGVSLHSYLDTSFHNKSDKFGHITMTIKENDTLTFSKDFFHPIYLFVHVKNFDTTHVIAINMVPSKTVIKPLKSNFKSLSDFNYHFVHDNIGNDSLRISSFEHVDASQVRKTIDGAANRRSDIYVVPNLHLYKGNTKYKLK